MRDGDEDGLGVVVGVDELVGLVLAADDGKAAILGDEVKEDAEQADASRRDDGGTAEDDDVHVGAIAEQDILGLKLRLAVDLDGAGRSFSTTGRLSGLPRGSWLR